MKKLYWWGLLLAGLFLLAVGSQGDRLAELNKEADALKTRLAEIEQEVQVLAPEAQVDPRMTEGRQKFEMFCMSCHFYERRPGGMLAPPVFAVKDHYTRRYDNEEAFASAIAAYVTKPSEEKSLMPGARIKFGLMPPMPVGEENIKTIARFLYQTDFSKPGWYDAHVAEEHGWEPPVN